MDPIEAGRVVRDVAKLRRQLVVLHAIIAIGGVAAIVAELDHRAVVWRAWFALAICVVGAFALSLDVRAAIRAILHSR